MYNLMQALAVLLAFCLALPPHALADTTPNRTKDIPEALQHQMESLVSTFERQEMFFTPLNELQPQNSSESLFLSVAQWNGVEFFAYKKTTSVKSLKWNNYGFGGSIDFCRLPPSLYSLYIEQNELDGSLDAAGLPRSLRVLMARGNYLSGTIAWSDLPPELTVCSIEHNDFMGEVDLSEVPKVLASLKVEGNQFMGVMGKGGDRLVLTGHLPEIPRPELYVAEDSEEEPAMDTVNISEEIDGSTEASHDEDDIISHPTISPRSDAAVSGYYERQSARRDLYPEFGGETYVDDRPFTNDSMDPSAYESSTFQTDTYDETTDGSMSTSHMPLSHSISEHHGARTDFTRSFYDDSTQHTGNESLSVEYAPRKMMSPQLSPILHNESTEMSRLELPPQVLGESKESRPSIAWSIASGVGNVFSFLLYGVQLVAQALFTFLVFPITQPYPSSVCFANY